MSSHSHPTGPADPSDHYATGVGTYGYGEYDGAYGEYNEYGERIQGSGHGQRGSGQGTGYGGYAHDEQAAWAGQQAQELTYAQQVAYAQQGYRHQQAYPEQGHAQQGHPEPAYREPGYAAAEPDAAYDPAPAAAPAPQATRPAPRPVSRTGTRTQIRAAAKARARRKRRVRNGFLGVGSVAAVAVISVAAFLHPEPQRASAAVLAAPTVASGRGSSAPADASRSVTRPTPTTALAQLPGLGPKFRAQVPADAQQVLLVTGTGKNANTSKAVLYTRTVDGSWLPGTSWAAHNAKDGWTSDHMAGDLHSPIGVFSLTDAGGLDANPGTKLPYLHSSEFKAVGTGFEGESLADAFDYVVAINYNHVPGTSPLSTARPMGASRGGGIWIHVDHGGPTHGCVSLAKADMAILLKDLDPSKHPVIVMGDATSLSA
jgi:L,D-peptidoglycan transpeptidase YkuD (ErfK/YbiS/YcfS/YnhG family)